MVGCHQNRKSCMTLDNENKFRFILYYSRLFDTLTASKVLTLDNENKFRFILYCSRLFVPLQTE